MSDSTEEMTILAELGQRARNVVEELARSTRARSEFAPGDTEDPDVSAAPRGDVALAPVHERLDELRACIEELTDVLEATVERLETVEVQLGDPSAGVEQLLSDGIQRCERVLMGIEHRVRRAVRRRSGKARAPSEAAVRASIPAVLVVAADSRLRSRICLELERQGFRALAATDLGVAIRMSAEKSPAVALLSVDGFPTSLVQLLEDWKENEERGGLPRAALLDRGEEIAASTAGFALIREDHGAAAMAASLMDLIHAAPPHVHS